MPQYIYPDDFEGTFWTVVDGEYYVSTVGNDITGDGSPKKPFLTVARAFEDALDGEKIVIGPDEYVSYKPMDAAPSGAHIPCRVATTSNYLIGIGGGGEAIIDGIQTNTGDRVLVWKQTNPLENGIYEISSGVWERAEDFNDGETLTSGKIIPIIQGNEHGESIFQHTTSGNIIINSSSIVFRKIEQPEWGTMQGTLADQTDLSTVLNSKADQSSLNAHASNTTNPHNVTKGQVGLGNVNNTSDANKPVSIAQQIALNSKANNTTVDSHITNTSNPHSVTKSQVGLSNVNNTSDADKPVSTAQQVALDAKAGTLTVNAHTLNTSNPHSVTKAQVGLGNVNNTSDANKPVSTAQQFALDDKADATALSDHSSDSTNPHSVTKNQVGLGNVNNTSDAAKPVSGAQQAALNLKANQSNLNAHTLDSSNPHNVTKAQVGLGSVNNTSDTSKPVSTAQQIALNLKADISYVDSQINNISATLDKATPKGLLNCSSNPNYPPGVLGDYYYVPAGGGGKIGGASGEQVQVGDKIQCISDTVAGSQAAVGANWVVFQGNLDKASTAEAQSGIEDEKYLTSAKSYDGWYSWLNSKVVSELSTTNKTIVGAINEVLSSETNNYLSGASFSTSNGVLTLSRSGLSAVTVDLDGRYLRNNQTISLSGQITGSGTTSISGSLTASAITGQTALTSGLTNSDELLVSDGGVLKRMDVSVLRVYMQNNLLLPNDFSVSNQSNNRVITSSGTGTGNAEANLTFDGTVLTTNTIFAKRSTWNDTTVSPLSYLSFLMRQDAASPGLWGDVNSEGRSGVMYHNGTSDSSIMLVNNQDSSATVSSTIPAIQLISKREGATISAATNNLRPHSAGYNASTKLWEVGAGGDWNFQGNRLKNLANPVNGQDAATRSWVLSNLGTANAVSASKWTTARTITLAGDLSGSTSIDGSANVTITAAVANSSHNHSAGNINSGTFNNARISQGNVTQHQGALSIGWGQITGAPSYLPTSGGTISGGLTVQGELRLNGTGLSFGFGGDNYEMTVSDSNPTWNGASAGATINWKGDNSNYNLGHYADFYHAATHFQAANGYYVGGVAANGIQVINAAGNFLRNAATASKWATARTISLTGDVTGSASIDGSSNVTITTSYSDDGTYLRANANDVKSGYLRMIDNANLRFGTGDDFRMYFDSANMILRNFAAAGGDIIFQGADNAGNNENLMILDTSGASGYVRLFQGNIEKFRTTGDGVKIYGNTNFESSGIGPSWSMNTDGAYIRFFNTGDSDTNSRLEYAVFDNNNEYHRWLVSGTEVMNLKSDRLNLNVDLYVPDQILHSGDSDTYMQFHGSNLWRVVTGGVEQLEVGSSYLEIPNQIRHTGDTNTYMQFHAADQWRVVTGGAERLEVSNSEILASIPIRLNGHNLRRTNHHTGHLEGIHTSSANSSYKTNPIFTIASSYNPSDAALGNMYGIGYSHTNATFINSIAGTGWGMYVASDGDSRIFLNASNGNAWFSGSLYLGGSLNANATTASKWATARTISLGGDLSGSVSLDGSSNVTLNASYVDDGTFLRANADDVKTGYLRMNDNATLRLGTGSDFQMWFSGTHTYFRSLAHSGKMYFQDENSSGTLQTLAEIGEGLVILHANNVPRFRTSPSGIIVVGAGTATDWIATSDERLKKNVRPFGKVLNKIMNLRGSLSLFDWKEGANDDVGYTAQRLQTQFPDFVQGEDTLGVSYGKLSSVALEGVAEVNQEVISLRSEVEELKKQLKKFL